MKLVQLSGDLIIDKPVHWINAHVQISGNLILKTGGKLTTDNSIIEIMNTYSRQYKVDWQGGRMITRDSTIGGTMQNGIIMQVNLELKDGTWRAKDTTVRYCYGIVCGSDKPAYLHATRLIAGPWPDSIIMQGKGNALVEDSAYSISLNTDCSVQGGTYQFDLPYQKPVNRIYDNSNLPGVQYRIELRNTSVIYWFLFASNVSMTGPPVELRIGECPSLIPSIIGGDLTGTIHLPSPWPGDDLNQTVTVGNLTWRATSPAVSVYCWGLYTWGNQTDLTVQGKSMICELMTWGGNVRVTGDEGTFNGQTSATTVETYEFYGKPGQLIFENATVGVFPTGQQLRGQVTAHENATIEMKNVRLGDVLLRTEDSGSINLEAITEEGKAEYQQDSNIHHRNK